MTEEIECFKCGKSAGKNDWREALVKIYSNEKEEVQTVDGKRKPTYSTKERWVCVECLLTSVASGAFDNALYAEVAKND